MSHGDTMNQPRVLLAGYLTTQEICQMFSVTQMTAYQWRRLPERPLPHYIIDGEKRPPLRYKYNEVKKWANERGKSIVWVPERFTQKNKDRHS